MRIGLIAYSTKTGLGYQTYDFARHIKCSKILIPDLKRHNGMPTEHSKFDPLSDNIRIADGFPSREDAHWITDDVDLLFVCETPLNYDIFDMARDKGVKTIMQYNYEFLEYYRHKHQAKPDLLVSPSYWNIEDTKAMQFAPVVYLPVPIDITSITPRSISEVKKITHVGGRVAKNDRNNTKRFIEFAANFDQMIDDTNLNRAELVYEVFLQTNQASSDFHEIKPLLHKAKELLGDRFSVRFDTENHLDMYKDSDLMILPRKYGGLCLPLWESLAHGVPVMMPNIDPNDKILPCDWLTTAIESGSLEVHSKVPMYDVDNQTLMMDVIGMINNIEVNSKKARQLAVEHSWDVMQEKYYRLFQQLVDDVQN